MVRKAIVSTIWEGHSTDQCFGLKHAIQDLINRGLLNFSAEGCDTFFLEELKGSSQEEIRSSPTDYFSEGEGARVQIGDDEVQQDLLTIYID